MFSGSPYTRRDREPLGPHARAATEGAQASSLSRPEATQTSLFCPWVFMPDATRLPVPIREAQGSPSPPPGPSAQPSVVVTGHCPRLGDVRPGRALSCLSLLSRLRAADGGCAAPPSSAQACEGSQGPRAPDSGFWCRCEGQGRLGIHFPLLRTALRAGGGAAPPSFSPGSQWGLSLAIGSEERGLLPQVLARTLSS